MKNRIEMIKQAAYIDELQKIATFKFPFKKIKSITQAPKSVGENDISVLVPGKGFVKSENIKHTAYIDELQKIARVGNKILSSLGKYPTLSGLGIGSTLGSSINVGELYYRKNNPKTKKDKTITNKRILGSAISGAIGGGLTGAYIGNTIGMFKRTSQFNPNDYNFKFDPNEFNFKYRNYQGFSQAKSAPLNTVGKQFEESLHKVKTKSDASKIFRSHVMQHHPDKGGKTENIQAINSAWENFKKYKFDKLAFFKFINEQSYKNELEKIAYDKNKGNLGNAALIAGGAVAIKKSAPLITGRKKLYHGTKKDLIEKIKKEGLINPLKSKVKSFNTPSVNTDATLKRAKSVVYLSPSKSFSRQFQEYSEAGGYNEMPIKEKLKSILTSKNIFNNKGILTTSIPTWKNEYKIKINPELRNTYKQIRKMNIPKNISKYFVKKINSKMTAFPKVESKYIKGSKSYVPFTKELGQYIKAKPNKFTLGAGLGLAGISSLGLGVKNIIDNKKK